MESKICTYEYNARGVLIITFCRKRLANDDDAKQFAENTLDHIKEKEPWALLIDASDVALLGSSFMKALNALHQAFLRKPDDSRKILYAMSETLQVLCCMLQSSAEVHPDMAAAEAKLKQYKQLHHAA